MNLPGLRLRPLVLSGAMGLGLVIGSPARAAAPTVAVGVASAPPGGSVSLPISLTGNSTGVAVQFDVLFEANSMALTGATVDTPQPGHVAAAGQPANGVARVILYSLSNTRLSDGLLVNLPFSLSPSAAEGAIAIGLTNVILVDAAAAQIAPVAAQSGLLTLSLGAGAQLQFLTRGADGQVQLQLTSSPNTRFVLQGTSDLVHWSDLSTNLNLPGTIVISNLPPPGSTVRFYRARYAP